MHDQSEDNHWGYGSIPAFVSHGEIWRTYWSTNARTFLGSITTDEYVNAQGLPQSSFRFGYITFNGSSWQAYTWPSSGTGWRAEYRNGKAVDGPAAYVRYNDTPVHDWGTTAPDGGKLGVWADNFSVKWLGRFYLVSGRYRFSTYSDDGVKLLVNGKAVLDHWVSGGGQSYTVEVDLAEGWHNLELRYFEDCGPAYINLGVVPVSFQGTYHSLESLNYPGEYIRHRDSLGEKTTVVSELDKKDATFKVVAGLADGNCISLEARNYPGYFLRHQDYRVKLHRNDGSQLFRQDATFCVKAGLADPNAVSLESKNYPGRYLRHRDGHLWVESGSGDLFRADATWKFTAPFWKDALYPDGTQVRDDGTGGEFLISGGQRHWIPDWETYSALGLDLNRCQKIHLTHSQTEAIPGGAQLPHLSNGQLFRNPQSGTISVLARGVYWIPNPATLYKLGFSSWPDIDTGAATAMENSCYHGTVPDVTDYRFIKGTPATVYYLDSGKRGIPSWEVYVCLGATGWAVFPDNLVEVVVNKPAVNCMTGKPQ